MKCGYLIFVWSMLASTGCGEQQTEGSGTPDTDASSAPAPDGDEGAGRVDDEGAGRVDDEDMPGMASDTLVREAIAAYCERNLLPFTEWDEWTDRCCTDADTASLEFFAVPIHYEPNVERCRENLEAAVAGGRLTVRPEFMEACIAAERAMNRRPPAECGAPLAIEAHNRSPVPTDALRAYDEACSVALEGLVETGDGCTFGFECGPNDSCDASLATAICFPRREEGYLCNFTGDCKPGLECAGKIGESRCTQGDERRGGVCSRDGHCAEGLVCFRSECVTPAGPLETCEGACTEGYACSDGLCQRLLPAGGDDCSRCEGRCDQTTFECVDLCGG
jgi:hypothetical protein